MALRTHRLMTQVTSATCLLLGLFGANSAFATVTEPSGLQVPIPQAQSLDYFDTAKYNESTLGIQNLLTAWETPQAIDAYADASATNVVFSPLCGLEGSMILRGGACMVDFGWYCTSDAPGAEIIHALITETDIRTYYNNLGNLPKTGLPAGLNAWTDLNNDDMGFVPTIQAGLVKPLTGTASLASVRDSPDFQACASKQIGFAFKGNPNSLCPMSKFSEPARNQMSTLGSPWINAVVYQSKRFPGTFYIAFEDMPTTAASFTPKLSEVYATYPTMKTVSQKGVDVYGNWANDGDFNDFVFKVSGIQCEGGGQACTPTDANGSLLQGACSLGVTACSAVAGVPGACQQKIQAVAETCNGWDDDCNGIADDGEGLCEAGYVCDNGACVSGCGSSEFPCEDGKVCETAGRLANYCVFASCKGVECPSGQRCDSTTGQCVGGCEGITCPDGFQCIAGSCIDLCAGVTCPDTFLCERGACIPNCTCLPCTDAVKTTCDTVSGRCVDPACLNVVCDQYLTCSAGSCVKPCDSNPCGTSACTANPDGTYACAGTGSGTAGSTGTDITISGTTPGTTGAGGSGAFLANDSGCGCRAAGSSSGQRGALLLAMLGLATTALRLRRRGTKN